MIRGNACRNIHTINRRHGFQARSIFQRIKYLLLPVDQQHVYFLFRIYMSRPVCNQETSVGEVLKTSEKLQRLSENIRIRYFPDRFSFRSHFYQSRVLIFIGNSYQRMSVRQTSQRMRTAGNIQLHTTFPFASYSFTHWSP